MCDNRIPTEFTPAGPTAEQIRSAKCANARRTINPLHEISALGAVFLKLPLDLLAHLLARLGEVLVGILQYLLGTPVFD